MCAEKTLETALLSSIVVPCSRVLFDYCLWDSKENKNVYLPSQRWSGELLRHSSPISPANIFTLTTSRQKSSSVRSRLYKDSHRPCFRRSGASQRDWSHFRCGKVKPLLFFMPPLWTNAWNRLSSWTPLSIRNISWRTHWCLIFRFLDFFSAANKWVQLRMNTQKRDGLQVIALFGGGQKQEKGIKKIMCCNGRSNSPREMCVSLCVIDHSISAPLFAAPLRRASWWNDASSSYVFRNLTPDISDRLTTTSRQTVNTAADTSAALTAVCVCVLLPTADGGGGKKYSAPPILLEKKKQQKTSNAHI